MPSPSLWPPTSEKSQAPLKKNIYWMVLKRLPGEWWGKGIAPALHPLHPALPEGQAGPVLACTCVSEGSTFS